MTVWPSRCKTTMRDIMLLLLLLLLFGLDLFAETRRLTSTTTNEITKPLFSFWPGLVIMSLFFETARVH